MPDQVYKVVELVGSSEESISKAIDRAIAKAALTVRHLGWFEVVQVRGHIEDGKVAHDDRAYAAAIALASEYAGKADAVARGEELQAEGKAATQR